jgi:TPR repeat protein
MLQLLLRRGDAMLALGDLSLARLLYARAASAGDARGAIGVAKTYDPSVLSQIGARGIKADSATAAVWYRKALELGDASAAARLRLLDQGRSE